MKKDVSIRQILVDSLGFIGDNTALLGVLALLSFAGSYFSLYIGMARTPLLLLLYGFYIYFFYFLFISLYYAQKPLLNKERIIDSLFKILTILALSMLILICGKISINIMHHLARGLIVFPSLYAALRSIYVFMVTNPYARIIIYLGVITLLSFSFFIPGFAWISSICGKNSSILNAYSKARGNYFKIIAIFVALYGLLPLATGFAGLSLGYGFLAILYAIQNIFQIIVYLHLYDRLYAD